MDSVKRLTDRYLNGRTRYQIKNTPKDYILNPKNDGYRSRHIVLLHPKGIGTDRDAHVGQAVELQIRTKLQHVWATASEGLGFHLGVSFKHGEGSPKWHRLFACMSELFAVQEGLEGRSKFDIAEEIRSINEELKALPYLEKAKNSSLTYPKFGSNSWVVLNYEPDKQEPTTFKLFDRFIEGQEYLQKLEGSRWVTNAVLLCVSPNFALRDAYPNYFADMGVFTNVLSEVVDGMRHVTKIDAFNESPAGVALRDAVKDGVFRNLRRRS